MTAKLTTEEFVKKSKLIHGDKYTYENVSYERNFTPVNITCNLHGGFWQLPLNHIKPNGKAQGCPECGKIRSAAAKVKTQDQILEEFKTVHGDKFDYSKVVYTGINDKVIISCPIHGEFKQTPRLHIRSNGCRKCANLQMSLKNKLTTNEFVALAEVKHKSRYDYSSVDYQDSTTEVSIICKNHGTFKQKPAVHLMGSGCPKCAKESRVAKSFLTTSEFIEAANIKHSGLYDYSKTEYVSAKTKVIVGCSIHGDFQAIPSNHLSGAGCPTCGVLEQVSKRTNSFEETIEKAKSVHNNKYIYNQGDYVNSSSLLTVSCPDHGLFEIKAVQHTAGQGCPKCSYQTSVEEQKLFAAFPQFERQNKSIIAPKHLDMYSENHKLAVEIDGRYWHSDKNGKHKRYHLEKTEQCASQGISLLHFWDDEINDNFPIVCSMISSRIGAGARLFARTTRVVELSNKESNLFLDKNHLQGSSVASVRFGLIHDDLLVAVMTFGKSRFSKKSQWEMLRFASLLNTTVVGGASKLFKHFVKTYAPESVTTYADRRYSEGKVYANLGFVFSHNSPPNYFYIKSNLSIPRYAAQKHKLAELLGGKFDPSKSEPENMSAAGYDRVFDCGNKVFVWTPT